MLNRLFVFVLAPGKTITEKGTMVERTFSRRATPYLGPRVPQQYILEKDAHTALKVYESNIVVSECWVEVADLFSSDVPAQREAMVEQCLARLRQSGADSSLIEDYCITIVSHYERSDFASLMSKLPQLIPALRGENADFPAAVSDSVLKHSIQYAKDDLAIVDWNGACLLEPSGDAEDTVQLLELANLQLLQYRLLDRDLDERLQQAGNMLRQEVKTSLLMRDRTLASAYRQMIAVRSKSLADFDTIERETKLIGEWYQAKLYELAAQRLRLNDWKNLIQRKIESIEDVYSIIADRFSVSRTHGLELLQIILFFVLQAGWFFLIILEFMGLLKH